MTYQSDDKVEILLVDDRPENLLALEKALETPGYRLVKGASGHDALRHLLSHEPALILMDVQMPKMDGYETAALIKKNERTRDIPIIFLTALNQDELFVQKGYENGAVDYISKPFNIQILKSKVRVFADLHRKSQLLLKLERERRESEHMERERKIASLELVSLRRERNQQKKYQQLVQGIDHGIVWAASSDDLVFSYVGPTAETLLGYSRRKWFGEPNFWMNHIHPDDAAAFSVVCQAAVHKQQNFELEHRFVTEDGRTVWLHTGVQVGTKLDSTEIELRGLSIDITRLKETEVENARLYEEAQRAIQIRDEFLSIASHELRTPLTPLKLQIQQLQYLITQSKELNPEKVASLLGTSNRQITRLSKLIDDLLDISRISRGQLQLELGDFVLNDLIEEVAQRFASQLDDVGCEIRVSLTQSIDVHWDHFRMEQVIVNLLTNAIKYAPGKPIDIRAYQDGENVVFSVQDRGMGIARQDQSRIFKQFERAVSKSHFGGLGLGLYIVSQILELHDGVIHVESEPGQGAIFSVVIPSRGPQMRTAVPIAPHAQVAACHPAH